MAPLFEHLPLYVAVAGASIAGYVDLRTTEIPDEAVAAMVGFAVLWGGLAFLTSGSPVLLHSVLVGAAFFSLGFLMYYTGQWGGGDAKLLAAVGMLVPQAPAFAAATLFPFQLSYLLNIFMLGAVYIIAYTLVISVRNERVTRAFVHDVRGNRRQIGAFAAALAAFVLGSAYALQGSLTPQAARLALSLVPGGVGLFVLWRFLRVVERIGFQKKIPTSKLREGDMLGENIPELHMSKKLIRGLEPHEIARIQKARKMIQIREGVRFGPVFVLALVYTIHYGDVISLMFFTAV